MSACLDCGGSECICRSITQFEHAKKALQIFTQALGSRAGYLNTLGLMATQKALEHMDKAGIKPVFHGQGEETKERFR